MFCFWVVSILSGKEVGVLFLCVFDLNKKEISELSLILKSFSVWIETTRKWNVDFKVFKKNSQILSKILRISFC